MTLPIEEALEGKYEILEKIGEGGIGSVYKVRHRLLDEIRVIKVLRPQMAAKEDHQERFLHEARMAIRLKHPNIAQLHDFSVSEEGTAFIVMEFIDGIALDALLKASGPPSLDMTLEVALQSLDALSYLHAHELVHRDVSPDNIMLTTAFDGSAHVKLIDLGIAKNLAEESGLTQTGVFLGKVRYCSPEQFSATESQGADLDHRSDIYSFGLLLYELTTGTYPFAGETFAELAGCHLFQPPIDFEQTDPEGKVSEELRGVILKALEKDPDARFASAADFRSSLLPFRTGDSSLRDEFNRTVERTTSAIPSLKDYTRPGSTQDRLNAEFGLGTTTGRRPLTGITGAKTAATPARDVAAPASSGPARWKWIAGIGGIAALVVAGIWFGTRSTGGSQETAIAEVTGPVVQIEPTERFTAPERDAVNVDFLNAPLPPESPPADGAADQDSGASTVPSEGADPGPAVQEPEPSKPEQGQGSGTGNPPSKGGAEAAPVKRTSEIYTGGVGVVPPVLKILAEPAYPDGKHPKSEIVVDVAVLVDEHGNVLTARVEGGAAFRRKFRDAAIDTAKASIFRPAAKSGVAGRMWTRLNIVFTAE